MKRLYGGIYEMLILDEKETCPYGKRCPNKRSEDSENGICYGLNPLRNTVFKCELVKEDGTIEKLEFRIKKCDHNWWGKNNY
jgi:hypothetical protein